MAISCGCSSGRKPGRPHSVTDAISGGEQGVAAESDGLVSKAIGRALRKQRSRWVQLTDAQRVRRMLLLGTVAVTLALAPLMMGASNENQYEPCPEDGSPTAESIPAMLTDCGSVAKLDLTDQSLIAVTIYAGDENKGGQGDLRRQVGRLMRGLHEVSQCYPQVKVIRADLLAPGEMHRDEYGNAVAAFEVPIVSLGIRTDDLRAFKQDFEWESYPIYAANRYARVINFSLGEVWRRELEKEEETGDFVKLL